MSERHDVWQLADRLQMDLRAAQARLVELRSMLAGLNLPQSTARVQCPQCLVTAGGPRELAEHVYHAHEGPTPAHWEELEQRIASEPSERTVPAVTFRSPLERGTRILTEPADVVTYGEPAQLVDDRRGAGRQEGTPHGTRDAGAAGITNPSSTRFLPGQR